jgi:hypothetical protein
MTDTVNIDFTEKEKLLLLKIFRINLPKDASNEKIDESFSRLLAKLQKLQESDKNSQRGVDFSELAQITLTPIKEDQPSPFVNILPKDSKAFIKALKDTLKEVPWASIALETAKCAVIGSSPQALAIAIGVELLMRVRFGNLFRGGTAAIAIFANNLNKMGLELAEETAKDAMQVEKFGRDAAQAAMKVVKAFVKAPHDAVLTIEGAATKSFSIFSKELTSLGEKIGLQVRTSEKSPILEQEPQEEKMHKSPFSPFPPTPFKTTMDGG